MNNIFALKVVETAKTGIFRQVFGSVRIKIWKRTRKVFAQPVRARKIMFRTFLTQLLLFIDVHVQFKFMQ